MVDQFSRLYYTPLFASPAERLLRPVGFTRIRPRPRAVKPFLLRCLPRVQIVEALPRIDLLLMVRAVAAPAYQVWTAGFFARGKGAFRHGDFFSFFQE